MSNVYKRNIIDQSLRVTRALTAADGSVTSSDLDLGSSQLLGTEGLVLTVDIPLLAAAELASGDTLIVVVQHGSAASPTTALHTFPTITGDGNDVAAQQLRFTLPAETLRYVNVKFTTSGTSGDMSDKTAVCAIRF